MSLVGNLEDLSLGDIMQIISLSQKSGLLVLKSDQGFGQIVFCAGLIHAARVKDPGVQSDDLRGLLAGQGVLDPAGFDAYAARAVELGLSVEETLSREGELDSERINSLLQESVESAVIEMFSWPSGDFSFDALNESAPDSPKLMLETGITAQYLAMEGMRVLDERGQSERPQTAADVVVASVLASDAGTPLMEEVEAIPEQPVSPLALDQTLPDHAAASRLRRGKAPPDTLVLVDPDVVMLEWVKNALRPRFKRVHVFQRTEQGLARIRQYLIRGELPVVLISLGAEVDPLSGIHGLADFVKRLKAQAAQLRVIGLIEENQQLRPALSSSFDDLLVRPSRGDLLEQPANEQDSSARALSDAFSKLLAEPRSDSSSGG